MKERSRDPEKDAADVLFEKHPQAAPETDPVPDKPTGRLAPPLLLPTVFMVVLSAYASVMVIRLANAPFLSRKLWLPLVVFSAALLLVGAVLRLGRYRGDGPLVALVMLLCGLGIVVQVRIGTLEFGQGGAPSQYAFPLGIIAMLAMWLIFRHGRHRYLEAGWLGFLLASLATVGAVLLLGHRYRGATFLKGNMNPVEIIKPLLVLFLAAILVGHRQMLRRGLLGIPFPPLNVVVTVALLWAPPMVMLLLQGDLGMIALLNTVALIMLYSVTRRLAYLLGGGGLVVLAVRFAVPLSQHAQRRFDAWSDPFSAATTSGWQILQGLVALYSGSWTGTGIGAGAPQIVPIVESDFVYVIFGEELGFVGCALLLLVYMLFVVRGFGIAGRTQNDFSALVATGLTACIAVQTFLNTGGVTKAIPLTGITLPLVSHGGSSLVTTLIMTGLLMAVSDQGTAKQTDCA